MAMIFNTHRLNWILAKWHLWFSVHWFLCADKQHNTAHQPVFSTLFMDPGLQKCEKKNAESCRKFPLPRASCVHSREKGPDGQWVEPAESQLGCLSGHFLLHFPGAWSGQVSELWAQRRQCQDPCLARRTLGQIEVGLEAGRRSEDKLLVSSLLGGKKNHASKTEGLRVKYWWTGNNHISLR